MTKRFVRTTGLFAALLYLVLVASAGCSISPTDPIVESETEDTEDSGPGGKNSVQPNGGLDSLSWREGFDPVVDQRPWRFVQITRDPQRP